MCYSTLLGRIMHYTDQLRSLVDMWTTEAHEADANATSTQSRFALYLLMRIIQI